MVHGHQVSKLDILVLYVQKKTVVPQSTNQLILLFNVMLCMFKKCISDYVKKNFPDNMGERDERLEPYIETNFC